jgi:hypothetical protein
MVHGLRACAEPGYQIVSKIGSHILAILTVVFSQTITQSGLLKIWRERIRNRRGSRSVLSLRPEARKRPEAGSGLPATTRRENEMATRAVPTADPTKPQTPALPKENDWTKPAAMAIPKEGYFQIEQGRYGPTFPKTPSCYGFTIIAKTKPDREGAIRQYGKTIEKAVADLPNALAVLRLHYLRWVLFDIGEDKYFMYQGIFDTDFDKYTEDAITLFNTYGINTVFENLEGFPEDWKTNAPAFVEFLRDHQRPSFLEYGEYPYVTADEVKKALKLKAAFSAMLDQMQ